MYQSIQASTLLPFDCLSADTILGQGTNSSVHIINDSIVLKAPWKYSSDHDDPNKWRKRNEESATAIAEEKAWYEELDKSPHPNRLRSLMITHEGIFLPRMRTTLKDLLNSSDKIFDDGSIKYRWALEIASAAKSLEILGLSHGDIKPRNIFIDQNNHIQLGDFDTMTRYGEIPILYPPHWIWYNPVTSVQHDLFGIGETLWEIFTGKEYDWGTPETANAIPDTTSVECGEIISRCWRQEYSSIVDLVSDLETQFLKCRFGAMASFLHWIPGNAKALGLRTASSMASTELDKARHKIESFLVK